MRNWMAHRYFDTAHAYVWATVDHDLLSLLNALERLEEHLRGSAK